MFGETTELTGGEHLVAKRCRTPEVKEKFMMMFNRYQEVVNRHKTSDLSDSQPTKGNIAGGLTTIEEKALGNIQKIGRKCLVDGVIDKAEQPTGPGLWFMDSSSAAAEMVTLCAASGYVVHFFPTGQGNVIGNPVLPVIKLCATRRRCGRWPSTWTSMCRDSSAVRSTWIRRATSCSSACSPLRTVAGPRPRCSATASSY